MSGSLIWSLVLAAVAFGIIYYPAFDKLARGLASPYAKADVGKRFSAAMVDGLLIVTSWFLYRSHDSALYLGAVLLYLVCRDSISGRSVGKFCFGLLVIDLQTGKPCGPIGSATRNIVFLLPGANLVALFLEAASVARDPQGQRLGDRLAQTQVVEGFGARDLAAEFLHWWRDFISNLDGTPRKPRRIPVKCAANRS
jgi:RDD family